MLGLIYTPAQKPKPPLQVVQSYANGLHLTAENSSLNPVDHTVEWRGNVVATYGPTTISADRVIVHDDPKNPYCEAIGHIQILDPEGTVAASYLKFFWKTHTGSAQDVLVKLGSLTLSAESADLQPELWTLRNVGGTGCKLKTPLYYVHTRELQVRPGVGVRVIHPELSFFGRKLLTLPSRDFTFGDTANSLDLPYPTIRSGSGFGINWTNDMMLNQNTGLFSKYAVFQRTLPFYNATVLRSGVGGVDPRPVRTEIDDRFTFGYFDNVQVRDPKAERLYLGSKRFDFGVASTFGADARDTTSSKAKINKPIEALGQASGMIRGFAVSGLFRAQDIQVGSGHAFNRLILEQNVLSPSFDLFRNVSFFVRGDAAEFTGGNRFGWLRGQTGLVFNINKNVRFGTSYTAAKAEGTPDFAYDDPPRFRELSLRGDFDYDTTQVRVLLKYDPSQRAVFDRELYVSRVIGCLEPYIVYRERPRKFFIGIKLPITRSLDRAMKAASERKEAEAESRAPVRHLISGSGQ